MTLLACFSSFVFVNLELDPEMLSLHCPLTPENRAKPMAVPHPFQGEATSSSARTSAA